MSAEAISQAWQSDVPSAAHRLALISVADQGSIPVGGTRFYERAVTMPMEPGEFRRILTELTLVGHLVVFGAPPAYTHPLNLPEHVIGSPSNRSLSSRERNAILERDGHQCTRCGGRVKLQVDHIIPRSRDGSNDPSNLQTLCTPCHKVKTARDRRV